MPVTSYPAEYLELYRQAAQASKRITLASPADARRMRSRLHSLRVEMRKESHRYTTIAEGVQITLDGSTLIASPSDDKFVAALNDAGITVEDAPSSADRSSSSLPSSPPEPSGIASVLDDLFRDKK